MAARGGARPSIVATGGADHKTEGNSPVQVQDAESFNEKVFLTSINDPGVLSTDVGEPEAFTRVKQLHGQIGGVVQTLNDKIAKVLQKQEKEFLAAYRAHMYQVQKELQALKARANEAEMQLKRNDKLKALEDEKEWYRKEALRLDKYATQLKSEMKFMKEKVEAVEEDRNWLEKQLKQSKKSSKLLRAELDVRSQTGGGGVSGPNVLQLTAGSEDDVRDGHSGGVSGGDDGSAPMFPPVRPSSQQARGHGGVEFTSPVAGATQPPAIPYQPPVGPTHNLASALAMVDRLQKELATERQTVKALRSANISGLADRTELETFFLQCIDEVRKDISKRRLRALAVGDAKGRKDSKRAGLPQAAPPPVVREHDAFDRSFAADKVRTKAKEPTLGDFTATDRRKVIDRLLADDYVLEALHHVIFSANQAGTAQSPQGLGLPGSSGSAGTGVLVPGVGDLPDDDELGAEYPPPGSAGSRFPTSFFPSSP